MEKHGFNSRSGKIAEAAEQLSPRATTLEPGTARRETTAQRSPRGKEDPALSRICQEGMETKMQTRDLRTLRGEERVGRTGRVARPHAHDRVWHGQLCEPL